MKRFSRAKVINCCLEKGQRNKFVPWIFFSLKKRLKNRFIQFISFSLCAKRNVKKIQHEEILSGEGHQLLLGKGAKKLICPVDFFLLEKKA